MTDQSAVRRGTLYLLPVPLGESGVEAVLPASTRMIARTLRHFIVEEPKTARHWLKQNGTDTPLQALDLRVLNEHSAASELEALLAPLLNGADVGLMSEAGCPAIADPGAALVALAQARGIAVRPLVGPSALLLALMASGLDGQRFAFHGYLPADRTGRLKSIAELERDSMRHRQTQLFIETPYRNNALYADLLAALRPKTRLCLATDLTLTTESVRTLPVRNWRALPTPDLVKRPTVFLLLG